MSNPSSPPPKSNYLWPTMITGLISTHIVAVVCMVYVAVQDRSFAVEPDYYRKALHWDQIKAQKETNERLGWSVKIALDGAPGATGNRRLCCSVADRAEKPIDGAIVELLAFSHARASAVTSLVLEPLGGGKYGAAIPCDEAGLWEFRLVVSRDHDVATYVEQRRI